MIVFRWLLPFLFAITAANAETVNLTLAPPTLLQSGAPIPATGPGSIMSYRWERGSCAGAAFGTVGGETTTTTATATFDLGPGTYCFRVFARNVYGESPASPVATRTINGSPPQAPTITSVAVVAGLNMAPLYRINADGTRGSVVLGFVPVGAECFGPAKFSYRGKAYHKVDTTNAKWWGTAPTPMAAAPCA